LKTQAPGSKRDFLRPWIYSQPNDSTPAASSSNPSRHQADKLLMIKRKYEGAKDGGGAQKTVVASAAAAVNPHV